MNFMADGQSLCSPSLSFNISETTRVIKSLPTEITVISKVHIDKPRNMSFRISLSISDSDISLTWSTLSVWTPNFPPKPAE